MQFSLRRMLVAMDGEGRSLENVIVEGERMRVIDRRGVWHEGVLKRVLGDAIVIIEDNGYERMLIFNNIDHVERVRR